ncbi:hypothetical protein [Streptomyces sp. NBC_00271]|jgi:hypothetical protein|uniref:hypothetical protein n=1 Tax=Streptomyces sp. NBC_00271 TaxID=2975697 RepID=UPI002E2B69AF|nr:hypothetical protein [Streptomyces sp. NBC_00271]
MTRYAYRFVGEWEKSPNVGWPRSGQLSKCRARLNEDDLAVRVSVIDRKVEFLRPVDVPPMIFPGGPVAGGAAHARKLARTAGVAPADSFGGDITMGRRPARAGSAP